MSIFRHVAVFALGTAVLAGGCFPGEIRDRHASVVDAYLPTPFVDPSVPFADAERALGPPDGRTVALGRGAHVVLRFFRQIRDGPGPDLRIYEVGEDGARAFIAVSADGDDFVELPIRAEGASTALDLGTTGLDGVGFVRVSGADDAGMEPGFDLDAVEALH